MNNSPSIVVVVTRADSVTGMMTGRALKRTRALRIRLVGLYRNPRSHFCKSRVWDRLVPVGDTEDGFLESLLRLASSSSTKIVLLPSQDSDVKVISDHRHELSKHFAFVLPPAETVNLFMDKIAFHVWADQCGLPVPRANTAHNMHELEHVLKYLTLPVIIKPAMRTHRWDEVSPVHKVIVIHKREDVRKLGFDLFAAANRFLVQEWIDGGDKNVYFCLAYYGQDGVEMGHYVGRKIVQWPIGTGSSALCVSSSESAVVDLAREILRRGKFAGLGSIEMKWNDRTQSFFIIEPTVGRNDLQSSLAASAGVNLTEMAIVDAMGGHYTHKAERRRKAIWVDEYSMFQAVRQSPKILLQCVTGLADLNAQIAPVYLNVTDLSPFLHLVKKRICW